MKVAKWLGILGLGLALAICLWLLIGKIRDPSGPSISDLTWEEDVTLASGENVRFKRHMRIKQEYSWGIQSMSAKQVQDATLEMLGLGSFQKWRAPLMPIYIDRDPANGEWVVIGATDDYHFRDANGAPCPPQYAFRLRKGLWYLQPVPKSFLGRLPNLLADLRINDDAMYSIAEWQTIVGQRKISQIPERGFRLTPSAMSVGEISHNPQCDGKEPQFTGEFLSDKDLSSSASLRHFPRLN